MLDVQWITDVCQAQLPLKTGIGLGVGIPWKQSGEVISSTSMEYSINTVGQSRA